MNEEKKIEYISVTEAAKVIGKQRNQIQRFIDDDRIPGAKQLVTGGPWAVPKDFTVLPSKKVSESKSAKAAEWLANNPDQKPADAARQFGIDRSALTNYLRRLKDKDKDND